MWDGVKSLGSKRITSSLTRRHTMKGNGIEGKTPQRGKGPNNSKALVSNPKEISSRRGLLIKRVNPKGMPLGNPKERVSITMKWAIIPKIAPNPNRGMGALR
jgi:hypothetical protein